MQTNDLQKHRDEILRLAAEHKVDRVRIFGSVARGEAQESSDVDFLVNFQSGASLLDHVGLIQDLEQLLGCEVDVVGEGGLSPYMADQKLEEATPL